MNEWLTLSSYAKKYYSQTGEDGVLERIFELIGTSNKVAVEFGAGNGYSLSNTRHFGNLGWKLILFDCVENKNKEINTELITAENINDIFEKYNVPKQFDLLSIDIDGNDLWVWKALEYEPRVVIVEINGTIKSNESKTVVYDPNFAWDGTAYYGASLLALNKVAISKGYKFVCQLNSLNAFFVKEHLLPNTLNIEPTYTSMQYHRPDPLNRPWVSI